MRPRLKLRIGLVYFCRLSVTAIALWSWNAPMALAASRVTAATDTPTSYRRYFLSTYASLDCLRSASGLINDRVVFDLKANETEAKQAGAQRSENAQIQAAASRTCPVQSMASITSPTNIALDLLSQLTAIDLGLDRVPAVRAITRTIHSLENLETHPTNHLFFSAYATADAEQPALTAVSRDVSSVDNIHLALALWSVAHYFPGTMLSRRADALFARMDFGVFYHAESGLMGGNLHFATENSTWTLESWSYLFYGSEARSISSIGYALGLFKQTDFIHKSTSAFAVENFTWAQGTHTRKLLRLWDGGAFQLYLPQILIDEAKESTVLARNFKEHARFMLNRQRHENLEIPAAFSASQTGAEGFTCGGSFACYNGKAGNLELVATANQDVNDATLRDQWESTFTPHAALLAAPFRPRAFARALEAAETLADADGTLYQPKLGWLDGYRLKNPFNQRVVPVQLALDQEMILLSLGSLLSKKNESASAFLLHRDPVTRKRLHAYMQAMDSVLEKAQENQAP